MLMMRWCYQKLGGHVHIRVFAAMTPDDGDYTLGKCGDLVMREDEFAAFLRVIEAIQAWEKYDPYVDIDFVPETTTASDAALREPK